MNKLVYFNYSGEKDICCGDNYRNFLAYAFQQADYFMLVYVNYYGGGYTKSMKDFKKPLSHTR